MAVMQFKNWGPGLIAVTGTRGGEGSFFCGRAIASCIVALTTVRAQADVLCGRIGILHLGKLQCVGTQLRLKNR